MFYTTAFIIENVLIRHNINTTTVHEYTRTYIRTVYLMTTIRFDFFLI